MNRFDPVWIEATVDFGDREVSGKWIVAEGPDEQWSFRLLEKTTGEGRSEYLSFSFREDEVIPCSSKKAGHFVLKRKVSVDEGVIVEGVRAS